MTNAEWKRKWASFTKNQKARIRAKAQWEHMSLSAVLREWPDGWEDDPISDATDLVDMLNRPAGGGAPR